MPLGFQPHIDRTSKVSRLSRDYQEEECRRMKFGTIPFVSPIQKHQVPMKQKQWDFTILLVILFSQHRHWMCKRAEPHAWSKYLFVKKMGVMWLMCWRQRACESFYIASRKSSFQTIFAVFLRALRFWGSSALQFFQWKAYFVSLLMSIKIAWKDHAVHVYLKINAKLLSFSAFRKRASEEQKKLDIERYGLQCPHNCTDLDSWNSLNI